MINTLKGKKLLLGVTPMVLAATITPPSTELIIKNETSCSLTLSFQQTLVAELSVPSEMNEQETDTGKIEFPTGWFTPTSQQGKAQYLVNCNNTHHILTFDFYVGVDHISDHNFFFNAKTSADSPFLVVPSGEVLIQEGIPLVITLINKADKHEETILTTPVTTTSGTSSTEGDVSDNEPDILQSNGDAAESE